MTAARAAGNAGPDSTASSIDDLRGFLALLREHGQLEDVTAPVDPVHELGAALHAIERSGKAVVFHQVRGHTIPVAGSVLGSHERIALALGCRREELGNRLDAATRAPQPCVEIDGPAACQACVVTDVDLSRLPVPTHAPLDGGPYINAGVVIGREPGGGRQNLSYVRFQVKGRDRIGVNLNTWRHLREFFEAAEARGRNLPFCVALGVEPALMLAAAYRYDGDEYEIAGALRGRPVPVVRAQTCDLRVPATAEIILECEILAGEREDEGPMAEYTGHYSGVHPQCVGRVLRITHRPQPLFQTIAGASFEHLLLGTAVTREPRLKQLCRAASPRVVDALLPPYASGFLALVKMSQPRPGEVRSVGLAALNAHVNISTVVVVDDDVDLFNPADVFWALSTRVHWGSDPMVLAGILGNELHPCADRDGVLDKVVVDATLRAGQRADYRKVVYPPVQLARLLGGAA